MHEKNVHTKVKATKEIIEEVDIVDEILGEVLEPSTNDVLQDVEPNAVWLSATNEDLDEMLKAVNDEMKKDEVKCEVCNITFQHVDQVEDHIGNVHIKVICDACSEELNTIKNLEAHKKAKHSDTVQEPVLLYSVLLKIINHVRVQIIFHFSRPLLLMLLLPPPS